MRGANSAKWVAGAIVIALAATACGGSDSGDKKNEGGSSKSGGTFKIGITEPVAIDPYNAQESEGILVTDNLFTGLYEPTADGKVIPALAESKEVSDDGKTWTFKIKGGTKFTNGEPVNAEAFIRGWNRVAQKKSASDVAYHLGGIDGFADVQAKQVRLPLRSEGRGREHPSGEALRSGLRVRHQDHPHRVQPRAEGGG